MHLKLLINYIDQLHRLCIHIASKVIDTFKYLGFSVPGDDKYKKSFGR